MLLASNLQLQSHLPGATQHHWRFPARSRANVSCHTAGANPHTSRVAPNRPMFAQRWQWGHETELSLQSRAHSFHLIFQKVSDRDICSTLWTANRALATVLRTFCQQLSQIETRNRGNRHPTPATPGATLPEKHKVWHQRVLCFHLNSHVSEPLHLPRYKLWA